MLDPDRTLSGTAIRLHGELMAGSISDDVTELSACWAVVMALTGYFLERSLGLWSFRGSALM